MGSGTSPAAEGLLPKGAIPAALANLSDRELQVFRMLGVELSTRETAEKLQISPKTIETYREILKTKLKLSSGAELVAAATKWVRDR